MTPAQQEVEEDVEPTQDLVWAMGQPDGRPEDAIMAYKFVVDYDRAKIPWTHKVRLQELRFWRYGDYLVNSGIGQVAISYAHAHLTVQAALEHFTQSNQRSIEVLESKIEDMRSLVREANRLARQ